MQIQNIHHGVISVDDYVQDFKILMMMCEFEETQERTISHFFGWIEA